MGNKIEQAEFSFPLRHGGRREGAGRKPGPNPRIRHVTRAPLSKSYPVHVTIPVRRRLGSLRRTKERKAIEAAFLKGKERFGFRLNHYSIQKDHLHLIVEATDRRALSRGMQGLLVRVAKALNKVWNRKGSVFRDRYHDHILRSPSEVRNALAYVLNNARKHGIKLAKGVVDGFSSARWFDGWRGPDMDPFPRDPNTPIARARTWLQRKGWRKRGLIPDDYQPKQSPKALHP